MITVSMQYMKEVYFFNFFEIIVYPHAVVGNTTERFCVLFIQFPPVVMYYKTLVQSHNQDIVDINWLRFYPH